LINPLATMLVYTIVFSVIFRARVVTGDPSGITIYPLWLMCGLLPWMFFVRVTNGAMASITSNGSLIKKVYFPRITLPLSTVGSVGFTWLVEMGVLSLALLIFGSRLLPWLPLLVVVMVLLAMFAVGLGMILSIVNVYFRDMQHLMGIVLQMWMYLTPIIYPVSLVEDAAAEHGSWILTVYRLNPMERFVEVFRNFLYDNRWPDPTDFVFCAGAALLVFSAGFLVFARNEHKLAELL
jgi:ABC-type polysaccharide/polyol phosphate export permease